MWDLAMHHVLRAAGKDMESSVDLKRCTTNTLTKQDTDHAACLATWKSSFLDLHVTPRLQLGSAIKCWPPRSYLNQG